MQVSPLPTVLRLADDGWLDPYRETLQQRCRHAAELRRRLVGEHGSLADFAQGHQHYGLHREADGSWVYRDWAPHATALWLVGEWNAWRESPACQAQRVGDGCWELRLPAGTLQHGMLYRLRMQWPEGGGDRLPAWGRRMVQDHQTHAFDAQVWAPEEEYVWRHELPGKAKSDRLLIYEAHPGMALEEAKVGSWSEFREQVLPRIAAAGYTAVQLMAVMEHPYYGSFGYHVANFFAPSSRFGTPEDLKALVDTAHGLGLRVIMDLVHSHAVKNEVEGISRYDGSTWQFFHEGPRGEHMAWDSRCFDYSKPAVLHFLLSNLRYWLEEYRLDGFRFDGVTSMLYLDHGLGAGPSSYADYFGGNVDADAVAYLSLATELMQQLAPQAIAIAEDVSGMVGLGASREEGGCGFHYRLSMGVPDIWFRYAADVRDEDWSMNALWHELSSRRLDERTISYVESHDQALVGGKSFFFQLGDADIYHAMHSGAQNLRVDRAMALHKMARMATLGAAGHGYLNFIGNEFGHPEWVDFPREGNAWSYAKARRQWSLRDSPTLRFHHLADFDQALLHSVHERWAHEAVTLVKADDGDKLLAFQRGHHLYVLNFHPTHSYTDYGLPLPKGSWQLILSTDEARFGGYDRVPLGQMNENTSGWLQLYLPTRVGMIWVKK
jgi:1,4-alpha-glucan branching enzyme